MPHYNRILAHYVALAAHPSWKAYVWARVQEMAREWPDMYASLPTDLTKAMTHAQASHPKHQQQSSS